MASPVQGTAIPLFLNPAAGRGRAGRKLDAVRNLLDAQGIHHTVLQSAALGDLEQRVFDTASSGTGRLIVVGGDGSIHEAVNGIMRSSTSVALGIIPIGTGNDFAKASGIPLHWEDAVMLLCDRLRAGTPPRSVDIGRMNDRYFANGAGVGFDAKVTRIARANRLPIGNLVYLLAVMQAMWDGVITPQMTIRYNERIERGPMTLANASNGAWVGGMFRIAPAARNDDGELDLVIAGPVSRWRILQLLPRLMNGTHIGEPEVSVRRIHECVIEADAPVPSHLDGEVQALQTRFEIRILPGALSLL
jgi:YegS/Rv2252/BmrU family lipid kinase